MRYSRNVKIFRGGVDAAPFAGLFFVLVLFVSLFYSHVFFPGVPIRLAAEEGPPGLPSRTVRILESGRIQFLGTEVSLSGLNAELRKRARSGSLPGRIILESEPGADLATAEAVENLLKQLGIGIKLPGVRMDLPENAGFGGAPNPVVVVGVNLNGQQFFQHQLISESGLRQKLGEAVAQSPEPLTLVLQADKKVTVEKLVKLSQIAAEAGIRDLRIATKPALE